MSFDQLGLSADLLRAVSELGYDTPTPIQLGAIPPVLAGRDLLAAAQTGTGKTAGFALPLLQRLDAENPHPRGPRAPRALVLVPTRELAAQVGESFDDYGRHVHQRTILIFGGVSPRPQVDALRQGVDIVVATPGRLLDHFAERAIDLSQVRHLVLDEADRMLDMGFIRDIRRVLAVLPKKRQNLLFSATFSDEIRTLATGLLHVPITIEVAARNAPAELVEHRVHLVEQGEKRAVLSHLLREVASEQTLVFTRTKHGANRLADQLARDGIECAAIHGNKSQSARTRALADFKELQGPGAGRHRHRGARARHRRAAAGRQLRAAARARGLRPPHRQDGSRRLRGAGAVAGVERRARSTARDRRRARPQDRCPAARPLGNQVPAGARPASSAAAVDAGRTRQPRPASHVRRTASAKRGGRTRAALVNDARTRGTVRIGRYGRL